MTPAQLWLFTRDVSRIVNGISQCVAVSASLFRSLPGRIRMVLIDGSGELGSVPAKILQVDETIPPSFTTKVITPDDGYSAG
jgi:hypothetical protein